jgi:hypothetical protein
MSQSFQLIEPSIGMQGTFDFEFIGDFHANFLAETKNSASCFNRRRCRSGEIFPMLPMNSFHGRVNK